MRKVRNTKRSWEGDVYEDYHTHEEYDGIRGYYEDDEEYAEYEETEKVEECEEDEDMMKTMVMRNMMK